MRVRIPLIVAALALVVLPGNAHATPAYDFEDIRSGTVDAAGAPVPVPGKCSESYVDRTCPGATLVIHPGSDRGYVGHAGKVPSGFTVSVTYLTADGREVYTEHPPVSLIGDVLPAATDLRAFMAPGDTLRVRVSVGDGVVAARPTAIEYAVMLALV